MSHDCCVSGYMASGTAQGTIKSIEGLTVYVSSSPSNNDNGRAVLFIHDAFGIDLINNKLLADAYAKEAEVTVYLPDLLHGTGVPVELMNNHAGFGQFDFQKFLEINSRENRWPTIESFAKALKEKHGVKKLASIGFCWGGWASFKLGATDLVDGIAVAHPSRVKFPDDIENIKKSVLFLCAEVDTQLTPELREKAQEIMERKKPAVDSLFKIYPGTQHGFAVRGDSDNKVVFEAANAAKDEAVAFFKRVL